jgi:hypothetical protein
MYVTYMYDKKLCVNVRSALSLTENDKKGCTTFFPFFGHGRRPIISS